MGRVPPKLVVETTKLPNVDNRQVIASYPQLVKPTLWDKIRKMNPFIKPKIY